MNRMIDIPSIIAVLVMVGSVITGTYTLYSRVVELESTVARIEKEQAGKGRAAIARLTELEREFNTFKSYICTEIKECD